MSKKLTGILYWGAGEAEPAIIPKHKNSKFDHIHPNGKIGSLKGLLETESDVYEVTVNRQPLAADHKYDTGTYVEATHTVDYAQLSLTAEELSARDAAFALSVQARIANLRVKLPVEVEHCRQVWLTSGDIKQQIYQEKQAEAIRWKADGSPDPVAMAGTYKYGEDRATRRGESITTVMTAWLQKADTLHNLGVQTEHVYETATEALAAIVANQTFDTAAMSAITDIEVEFYKQMTLLSAEIWTDPVNETKWQMQGLPSSFTITEVTD